MEGHEFTPDEIEKMAEPDKIMLSDGLVELYSSESESNLSSHIINVDHPLFDSLAGGSFSVPVLLQTIRHVKRHRDEARSLLTKLYDAARDANIWLFQAPPHDHDGRAKVASQLNRTLIEVNNEIDDSLKALQQYLRRQEDAKKAEGGE